MFLYALAISNGYNEGHTFQNKTEINFQLDLVVLQDYERKLTAY